MLFRSLSLSVLMFVAATTGVHAAATIASAPLAVGDGQSYTCAVVNAGSADLSSVTVVVSIGGATPGSGTSHVCTPLAAGAVCAAQNDAGSANYRYCSLMVAGNRKSVRGTFCNDTAGRCVPVQ